MPPIKIKVPSNKHQTLPEIPFTQASTSPPIAPSASGHHLLIDKLSIMLTPASKEDAEAIHGMAFSWFNEISIYQSAKKQGGFSQSHNIALAGSSERVRFDYKYEGQTAVRCRLEFNPFKIGAAGLHELHSVLPFPSGWPYVIQHGRMTRLDVAVDLSGLEMHQFLFLPQQGMSTKTWARGGELETLQVGKPHGNSTIIYSKDKEQLAKKKGYCGPKIVRVERRLKQPPLKLVSQLTELPNPFAGMVMTVAAPPPPPGEKTKRWELFILAVAGASSLNVALAHLSDEKRTAYRKHLKAHPHPIWNADLIWSGWQAVLNGLGLVDPSAYH